MNLQRIATVLRKEIIDGFRDRRALFSVLIGALISPLIMAFLLNQIASEQRNAREIRIPIVGREYGPLLVDWLEQQSGVEIVPGPANPEEPVPTPRLT